jgi:hypothetical protein
MKSATLGLAAFLVLGCGACLADDFVAAEQHTGSKLEFRLKPSFANATLSVAGPNNFHASSFSKGGAAAIDLSQFGRLDDGTYDYQVTASSGQTVAVKTPLDNGRDKPPAATQPVSVTMSGSFHVRGGQIVKPDMTKSQRKDR